MKMKLKIGDTVKCIKTVNDGTETFFTKGCLYPVIDGDYPDENSIWLKDDFKSDNRGHQVSEQNGQLGDWFYKHFIII